MVPLTREVWIEETDFREADVKGYYGLAPGKSAMLKCACWHITDASASFQQKTLSCTEEYLMPSRTNPAVACMHAGMLGQCGVRGTARMRGAW